MNTLPPYTAARKAVCCSPQPLKCIQSCAKPELWYSRSKWTAQQLHTDLISHLLRATPPHFPQGGVQAKQPLCHHHGCIAPTDSQGRKSQAQRSMQNIAVPCRSLSPRQCIIHLGDIFLANSAKQKYFSFNVSRTRELLREKLLINSPLLFAVVIYSEVWWGCCHVS